MLHLRVRYQGLFDGTRWDYGTPSGNFITPGDNCWTGGGVGYSENDVSALRANGASALIARAGKGGNLNNVLVDMALSSSHVIAAGAGGNATASG